MSVLSASPLVLANGKDRHVKVLPLNFEQVSASSLPLLPDIVIGADLVYHADLLPHLVNTLSIILFCSPSCVCFLACAQRETFPLFLQLLEQADLETEQWPLEGGSHASQKNSNPLLMLKISAKETSKFTNNKS